MRLLKNICALEKLCCGRGHGAVGREFKVSESTVYIKSGVFKWKPRTRFYVDWLMEIHQVFVGTEPRIS